MLINPSECSHDKVVKQKNKTHLCLLCLKTLEEMKQPTTLGVNVSENIATSDKVGG